MNDLSVLRPIAVAGPVGPLENSWGDVKDVGKPGRRPFRRRMVSRTGQGATPSASNAPPGTPPKGPPVTSGDSEQRALTPYIAKSLVRDDWQGLRLVSPGPRGHFLSGVPLVDFFRADPAAKAFDLLRTRLLQTLRVNGWNRIAVASPTRGCGSTFTAVNLALSLARIPGSRNVLMDLNHRAPGIANALELAATGDMRGFLQGDVSMGRHLVRSSETLALGLAAGPDPDAAEMLHDSRTADTLNRMNAVLDPDVVLYDLPPILEYDDLAAFLPQVDGVLLVSDGTRSLARHIAKCERILEGQTQVLGVILNRARRQGRNEYDT